MLSRAYSGRIYRRGRTALARAATTSGAQALSSAGPSEAQPSLPYVIPIMALHQPRRRGSHLRGRSRQFRPADFVADLKPDAGLKPGRLLQFVDGLSANERRYIAPFEFTAGEADKAASSFLLSQDHSRPMLRRGGGSMITRAVISKHFPRL